MDVNHTAPVNGIGPRTITPTAGSNAIRVTIARQVVVEIGEKTRFRTLTIGVGRMWPLPPQSQGGRDGRNWNGSRNVSVDDLHRPGQAGKDEDKEDVCLDWQGEVKCWPEVVAGGFGASGLHVKVCALSGILTQELTVFTHLLSLYIRNILALLLGPSYFHAYCQLVPRHSACHFLHFPSASGFTAILHGADIYTDLHLP